MIADELAADDLERFRSYLGLLARAQVGAALRAKIDLSGVVQQTLIEAQRDLARREGSPPDRPLAWLRRILANNLADELRRWQAGRRDAARERSLEAALDASSQRLDAVLVADETSPSGRASRSEDLARLADALATLPDNQRRAVELHHLGGLTLAAIADELGTTRSAVAGLLHRGLVRLRSALGPD